MNSMLATQSTQGNKFGLNKTQELQHRLLFTLFALIVYRLGCYIPLPGIQLDGFANIFENNGGGVFSIFDTFTGGSLRRMAIFSLGVMPYISASIVMQLAVVMFPGLSQINQSGQGGRNQIIQYTRYLTLIFALANGALMSMGLQSLSDTAALVIHPGTGFVITAALNLAAGTIFLMWLGEQITSRGVGNGVSLIIFTGIIAEFPTLFYNLVSLVSHGAMESKVFVMLLVIMLTTILLVVFFERSYRMIPINYPKRQQGARVFAAQSSYLPLKINTAGVIPPIFASSLLLIPITVANFYTGPSTPDWMIGITSALGRGQPMFLYLYIAGIIFFSFFYTAIMFNASNVAEQIKQQGGFVASMRPGEKTAEYLDHVLARITMVGALYLSVVCVVPELIISNFQITFFFGGTSLLIIVNVIIDTVGNVQNYLFAQQYESLLKKSKLLR